VNGQGVLGCECSWCGLPAVCEVEVEPVQRRMIGRVDPVTGKHVTHQRMVRAAITAPACDEHRHVTSGQASPVRPPREQRARDVAQLDLFATGPEAGLRDAICREVGR